ncbi:MFS transporter [Escherichia albertii]|nr:MFS transporter [Escherichia albertii]MCZ8811289.1 MFS transporter [Escherichia albertii]
MMWGANNLYIINMPLFIIDELHFTDRLAGEMIGIAAGLEIPAMLIAGYFIKRIGKRFLMLIAIVSGICFYASVLMATTPTVELELQILNAIFLGILCGIGMLYFQDLIPKKIGFATTLYANTSRVGWIIAGSLDGIMVEIWSYHSLFWLAIGMLSIAMICLLFIKIVKNHKDAISLLIFSVLGALTVQLTFLLTIEKSNAATATVLQFLSPTIIVAWFSLVRKSRPGILVFAAIMTSLIGTFLLVTHGNPTSLSISPAALFWGIASAFAAAFYTTYPSTLISRYGTLPIVGWSMLIGGLILLPFYSRQGTNFVVNGSLILAFFYLVVIGTSLTFSLYLKGAQLIGGPKASILSCAEPLSSALLSLLLLGITFTLPDWLGTLLILSSVILISMDSRRRTRKI